MGVNKVILVGNAGRDTELRYTESGIAVAGNSLATNEVWYSGEGKDREKQERVTWTRLVWWRRLAEIADEYVKKGKEIYVEGRLQNREWTDKDGIKRYVTEVIVQNMQLLGGGGNGAGRPDKQPDDPMNEPTIPDDDIPF